MVAMEERELTELATLTSALLEALDILIMVGRYMNPPDIPQLVSLIGAPDEPLRAALATLEGWPEDLEGLRERLVAASNEALSAFDELRAAARGGAGARGAYRALRHLPRAQEALYPLATDLPPVSRFFLDRPQRGDSDRLAALSGVAATATTGLLHHGGEPGARGGFSAYVPEDYDPARGWPLVMALHGGSGNGRGFLWSWLRAARGHGAILIAPTALGDTWALMGPDPDSPNLAAILDMARGLWNLDDDQLLLTGMSDGGTFALVSGLEPTSPFTHLAPAATGFPPFLVQAADPDRLRGLPIHLTHGALDWMFPVDTARQTAAALAEAGANVVWREIEDLAHVYPSEINGEILDWMATTPTRAPTPGG